MTRRNDVESTVLRLLAVLAVLAVATPAQGDPVEVTVADPDPSHVLTVDALRGKLDAPILFVAGADGDPTDVEVRIGPARRAGVDRAVPLRLVQDEDAGADVGTVNLAKGTTHVLRLVGDNLDGEGTYSAELLVGGRKPQQLVVHIRSSQRVPLGLRAREWVQADSAYPALKKNFATTCIPVDQTLNDAGPHVVIEAPLQPRPDSQRLSFERLQVTPEPAASGDCPANSLALRFGPVEPGRYDGVLDIESEKLPVQLTLRPPAWTVFVSVLLGALLSLAVRGIAKHLRERADGERRIADAEAKAPRRDVVLDTLIMTNEIRRARGKNRLFLMDGIDDCLKRGADVKARPEPRAILTAIDQAPLPGELRRRISGEMDHWLRLSADADADEIQKALGDLASEAAAGFRARFQPWLAQLRDRLTRSQDMLEAARKAGTASGALADALSTLDLLVSDAALLFDHAARSKAIGLEKAHVGLLERVMPTLDILDKGQQRLPPEVNLVDIAYSVLTAEPPPASRVPVVVPSYFSVARVTEVVPSPRARALEGVTFEVRNVPPVSIPRLRFEWRIGGAVVFGGPRLTHVFGAAHRFRGAKIEVQILPMQTEVELVTEKKTPHEDEVRAVHREPVDRVSTILKRLRTSAFVAEQAALIVGVVIASGAAAIYWIDKPFGSLGDYVNLFAAGVGIDAGTNNAVLRGLVLRFSQIGGKKGEGPLAAPRDPADNPPGGAGA